MTFSIKELLAIVLTVSVCLVALLKATPWIADLAILVAWLTWTACAIVALSSRGPSQRFATGFVVAGASFALVCWASFDDYEFPTVTLLGELHEIVVLRIEEPGEWKHNDGSVHKFKNIIEIPDPKDFVETGMSIFTLVFGYLGGKFALFLCRRSDREGAHTESGSEQ